MSALLLDDWTVLETRREPDAYRISARYEVKPDHCPVCGFTEAIHKHDIRSVDYADAQLYGLPTTTTVNTWRYKCLENRMPLLRP